MARPYSALKLLWMGKERIILKFKDFSCFYSPCSYKRFVYGT